MGNTENNGGRLIYGMMEILPWMDRDWEKAIELTNILGAESFRMIINAGVIMNNDLTFKAGQKERFAGWMELLTRGGVEQIIGMSGSWFLPSGVDSCNDTPDQTVPLVGGGDYREFMLLFEKIWFTLSSNFPQIDFWEMGNEVNHTYITPPGTGNAFSQKEKAIITADMMFYASRGIKRGNPRAVTVMPALAPCHGMKSIKEDLELIYLAIESGECGEGSKCTDDYFDVLAWHPYVDGGGEPDEKWLEANNEIYRVAKAHGDNKRVMLTELGWPDHHNRDEDENHALWYKKAYSYVKNSMDYVDAMHVYCLLDYENYGVTWGLFDTRDGAFRPKQKAYAIQSIFGGKGDLNKYVR